MPAFLEHDARPPQATGVVGFFARVVGWIALTAWHATRITLLALLVAFEPVFMVVDSKHILKPGSGRNGGCKRSGLIGPPSSGCLLPST